MQIRLKEEDIFDSVVFEVLNDNSTAHKGLQYILIEFKDGTSIEHKFKKRMIVDYLLNLGSTEVSWKEIDREIENIMSARVHCL